MTEDRGRPFDRKRFGRTATLCSPVGLHAPPVPRVYWRCRGDGAKMLGPAAPRLRAWSLSRVFGFKDVGPAFRGPASGRRRQEQACGSAVWVSGL